MLRQFSGIDFEKNPEKFDFFADQFEKIPIYFQSFFGSTDPSDVINLIDYALYTYDIGHVVLDNLQFMLSGQGKGFERFEMQDDLISKLRNLATEKNVHISLVIHPKKTEDDQDLHISSIFGTSKSTQESDNIFILQNRKGFKVLDIKKNRYDGEIGKAPLVFCKESKRYYNINNKDVEDIYNNMDVTKILDEKKKIFEENCDGEEIQGTAESKEDVFFEKMKKDCERGKLKTNKDFGGRNLMRVKEIENEIIYDSINQQTGFKKYSGNNNNGINSNRNSNYNQNNLQRNNNDTNNIQKNNNQNNFQRNNNQNNFEKNNNIKNTQTLKINTNNDKIKIPSDEKTNSSNEPTFLTEKDREIYQKTILQNISEDQNLENLDNFEIPENSIKNDYGRIDEIIEIDHDKWNLDKKKNPNFYENGETITYEDIVNQITSFGSYNNDKKDYRKFKKKNEFFDDYLDFEINKNKKK